MTNLLIMSDSHGLTRTIQQIVERHDDVDGKIHCGDSELSNDAPELQGFHIVKGNCDWNNSFPEEEIINLAGLRVFVTHGHLYGVKSSLLEIQYRAEELGADIVLFGHSHVAYAEQSGNLLLVNPGSIRQARRWKYRTYVILSISENKQVTVTFYDTEGNKIESFPFKREYQL